jgi:hypothetical protein
MIELQLVLLDYANITLAIALTESWAHRLTGSSANTTDGASAGTDLKLTE